MGPGAGEVAGPAARTLWVGKEFAFLFWRCGKPLGGFKQERTMTALPVLEGLCGRGVGHVW